MMGEGRYEIRRQHVNHKGTALGECQAAVSTEDAHRLGRIMRMGAWLSVLPSTINGEELGVQEWKGSLFLRYGIDTPDRPENYDGFVAEFYICHTLY